MARLVLTHSTYIDGLLKWAKKLSKKEGIKTITPGVIGRTKGRVNNLTIRITRETREGFKLIARNGNCFQEIYIVTSLCYSEIKELLEKV